MIILFYFFAFIAVLTSAFAITRSNPVYALLSFILSLLAMSVIFYMLGAPFAAALEVIVYAGAIMVLFLFVVMMLGRDILIQQREKIWITHGMWLVPLMLVTLLAGELTAIFFHQSTTPLPVTVISPQDVGARLFGVDIAAVELASMLLLAGLVGAFHLGRPISKEKSQ